MTHAQWLALAALAGLSACTVMPTGPTVMALPGTGKSFDQFRADDASCRNFANQQVGGVTANQAATNAALGSAVVGTALGAAAGAAFNGGQGAAVGAGVGLLAGSVVGAGNAQASGYGAQRRYDHAYIQCMYASGDKVPVSGRVMSNAPPPGAYYYAPPPPPPGAYIPPPPPGY
ncbi:glycine zipper family protein [Trinickia mobilis]|uniref:glycine zipper family protein n=1 Tax=Trinickia mobilis TaxID=2816356 RepID=UPI001A908F4F|nr:glycine zipper family protein [Trinickia mobilis]